MSQRDDFILCCLISKNQNEGENCVVAEMKNARREVGKQYGNARYVI